MNLKFHLTQVRMADIKNSGDSRCWRGCGERGTFLHCWWDFKLVQPLQNSVWRFIRKLDVVLPEDPTIPLLGIYRENVPTCNNDTCYTMSIAALLIIARSWKEHRCPSTEELIQRKRKCGTFTQWSTTQLFKNELMKFLGKWMDLEYIS